MSYHTFDELDGSYPNMRKGFIPNYLLPDYRVVDSKTDDYNNTYIVKKISENITPFSKPHEEYLKYSYPQVPIEYVDANGSSMKMTEYNGPHMGFQTQLPNTFNVNMDKRYTGMYSFTR